MQPVFSGLFSLSFNLRCKGPLLTVLRQYSIIVIMGCRYPLATESHVLGITYSDGLRFLGPPVFISTAGHSDLRDDVPGYCVLPPAPKRQTNPFYPPAVCNGARTSAVLNGASRALRSRPALTLSNPNVRLLQRETSNRSVLMWILLNCHAVTRHACPLGRAALKGGFAQAEPPFACQLTLPMELKQSLLIVIDKD